MDKLKKGDLVTVFGISDWMGSTTHGTFKATGDYSLDKPIFTDNKKGARKKFTLRPFEKPDQLVFLGDTPFKSDGEVTKPVVTAGCFTSTLMRGNACLNLVGDIEVIKDWVLNKNINKNFTRFDEVIHIGGGELETETPVFPEVPTSHAVVERIRNTITK